MNTENQPNEHIVPEESKTFDQTPQALEITKDISSYLRETGKWTKFLAILGFVGMGLMVLLGFIFTIVMTVIPSEGKEEIPFPPVLFGLFYLIMATVYFFPILYLFRFSTGVHEALFRKEQNQLVKAFYNLRKHYRFIGILMIVMFGLYILIIAVALIAGMFAGISSLGGGMAA